MTFPSSNYDLRKALLVCFAAWAAACSTVDAPKPAATPDDVPGATSVEPVTPPTTESSATSQTAPPAPSAPASQGPALQDIITRVAKKNLWPLEPGEAEKLLQTIGPVRRDERASQVLSLSGGPSGALARFEVSYTPDENGHWAFNVASFFLGRDDYERVEHQLTEQVGKPEWTGKNDDIPSTEWGIGRSMKLLLGPSPNLGDELLVMSISEPEGEGED